MITANEEELRRALGNLVANAVRHARTRVELAADLDQDEVMLSVSDDGPGVPPADRERVFERFTRLDDARARDFGGSGLGLPIVRELVHRAGGRVALLDADPPLTLSARDHACREQDQPTALSRMRIDHETPGGWHSCPLVC